MRITLLRLACESLRNRKFTTGLTIFFIALSVMLLVGVDRIRQGPQVGFEGTLSQTNLLVGARDGSLPLLLYAVDDSAFDGRQSPRLSYRRYR
jgi:putative ABC transport system permease protein